MNTVTSFVENCYNLFDTFDIFDGDGLYKYTSSSKYNNSYIQNKLEIIELINNNNYDKLIYYTRYDLVDMSDTRFGRHNILSCVLLKCREDIIEHILDNSINLEGINTKEWRPIHFICKYSRPNIIKYVIDKYTKISEYQKRVQLSIE